MKFFSIITNPGDTIERENSWLVVAIVTFLIMLITYVLNVQFNFGHILKAITEHIASLPQGQQEKVARYLTKKSIFIRGGLSLIITFPLELVFIAALLQLLIPIFGSEEKFADSLIVAGYGLYIRAIGAFVKFLLVTVTGVFPFHMDLSLLIPQSSKFFYYSFEKIELFGVWAYYVLAVGIAKKSGMSKKNALVLSFSILLVWAIIAGIAGVVKG